MEALYKLHIDCGRMGELEGVFVADFEEMEEIVGKYAYFGEVLGKHSEICGKITADDFSLITSNKFVIDTVKDYHLETGFNPLDYIQE